MTGLALSILSGLALFADAATTYRGIKLGSTESNPVRAWAIRKLGLVGGTFGVAAVTTSVVSWINLNFHVDQNVVFMNLAVILSSMCAAVFNSSRGK